MTHDQNFKNLILDYPRETIALFAAAEARAIDADAWVDPGAAGTAAGTPRRALPGTGHPAVPSGTAGLAIWRCAPPRKMKGTGCQ
jgi:hypothetical protein